MKDVAITGMGIVSCLGNSLQEVNSALQQGRSGIVYNPERKEMGFRSGLIVGLGIPQHGQNPEGAAELIEYLTRPAVQQRVLNELPDWAKGYDSQHSKNHARKIHRIAASRGPS